MVARELLDGRPLADIPLMTAIAERTLAARSSRVLGQGMWRL